MGIPTAIISGTGKAETSAEQHTPNHQVCGFSLTLLW